MKISIVPKTFLLFVILAALNFWVVSLLLESDSSFTQKISLSLVSFVILGTILSLFVKKKLSVYTNSLTHLTKNGFEEKLNVKGDDEFAEVALAIEDFRQNLRNKITSAEESKDRVEAILFNVGEGVFAVNLRGEIMIFSHVAEQLVGFSKDQVVGQEYNQFLQFLDPKTNSYYGSFIDKVLLEGKSITLPPETVLITSTQTKIPVAVNASPIRNQKGIIIGGIVVFRDTSREKELEEMRNDLISIASHQLRTPLSEIKGLVELLNSKFAGPLNEKQSEYMGLLTVANERMINLVNDLLNISRIEQGRIQFQYKVTDLGEIAQQVFTTFKLQADKKTQHLLLNLDSNKHLVWVDPEKTREVISNLFENALKYTFEGGTIQARVTSNNDGIWFLIKDTGVGIPKDRQKDLFQKFSRVENPLSKTTSGTGLGLYTVKQLVEKQNGKLWFQSEEGKGSIFAFVLPPAKTLS